jgi:hypothetical protein
VYEAGLVAQLTFAEPVHVSPEQVEVALIVNLLMSNCASRWSMYHCPASVMLLAT